MSVNSPIDINRYVDQTRPWEVTVEPGGNRAVLRAAEFDRHEPDRLRDLFIHSLDPDEQLHRLTRVSSGSLPRWNPDGSMLGFVSNRDSDRERQSVAGHDRVQAGSHTSAGGEGAGRQVYAFDFERGGYAVQLTDLPHAVLDFDWSPDGRRIVASVADRGEADGQTIDEPEDGGVDLRDEYVPTVTDGSAVSNTRRRRLYVIHLAENRRVRLTEATDSSTHYRFWYRRMHPQWGTGGRITFAAAQTDDDGQRDVFTIQPDGSDCRRHTNGGGTFVYPEWDPSGRKLVCTRFEGENRAVPAALHVADLDADGRMQPVASSFDRTTHYAAWYDSHRLLGLVGNQGQWSLYEFRTDEREPTQVYAPSITHGSVNYSGIERPFGFDPRSGTVATIVTAPTHVGLHTVTLTDEDDRLQVRDKTCVEAFNNKIVHEAPTATERIQFESSDGQSVEATVYLPRDYDPASDPPLPTVVDSYRGLYGVEIPRFRFRHQYRTSRGFAVLRVHYRGSNTYGESFAAEAQKCPVVRETEDLQAAIAHVVEQRYTDPDAVYAVGFGHGATVVVNLMCVSDRVRAGAALHGVYDFAAAYGTDERLPWWNHVFGRPDQAPETYERSSPVQRIDGLDDPLLLVTAEDDSRVPPEQTRRLHTELAARDTTVRTVRYSGFGYDAFGPPDVAMHRLQTIQRWFREH